MAISNPETIEIRESELEHGKRKFKRYELYVDNCIRASATAQPSGHVNIYFHPKGSFDSQEGLVWIQGLLELSIYIEGMRNVKK